MDIIHRKVEYMDILTLNNNGEYIMAMKLFTKKGGKNSNPAIAISKAGQIGINSSCLDKYFQDKEYVMLYGDTENRRIGIQPIDKYKDNAFKISLTQKKTSGSISGNSFLKHLKIDFKDKDSGSYTPEWDENNQMLIITLK
jgi:hypothetical protein